MIQFHMSNLIQLFADLPAGSNNSSIINCLHNLKIVSCIFLDGSS